MNKNTITILYWGTIVEKKGVLDLPLIFNRICEQNDNVKLILIGQDAVVNGSSTWEKCKSLFSKQSIGCVSYLGRLPYDKTMSYANSADICIFPSHAETSVWSYWRQCYCGRQLFVPISIVFKRL
mgnify:FL=1